MNKRKKYMHKQWSMTRNDKWKIRTKTFYLEGDDDGIIIANKKWQEKENIRKTL